MAGLIYIVDANVISDLLARVSSVEQHLDRRKTEIVCLCQPVYYELIRGLIKTQATSKLQRLEEVLRPSFNWITLTDDDWLQAARYWALATGSGRQLSDVDLLIAAIATRLDAIIVTSDADFDALPVKRENWRTPPPGS